MREEKVLQGSDSNICSCLMMPTLNTASEQSLTHHKSEPGSRISFSVPEIVKEEEELCSHLTIVEGRRNSLSLINNIKLLSSKRNLILLAAPLLHRVFYF
jgi:hypothetical protein